MAASGLDLRAVERLRCERTGHPPGTDTMPLGACCPCPNCRAYFALVGPLLVHVRALTARLESSTHVLDAMATLAGDSVTRELAALNRDRNRVVLGAAQDGEGPKGTDKVSPS